MKAPTLERVFWFSGWAYDFSKIATVLLILGLICHYFFFSVLIVRGRSMLPNYVDGQVYVINKIVYKFRAPERGDAIAMYFPGETSHRFIKRVIGLPGEKISIFSGRVSVNGRALSEPYLPADTLTLPDLERALQNDEYYVMGDNRNESSDSRAWGPVPANFIVGKVETKITTLADRSTN